MHRYVIPAALALLFATPLAAQSADATLDSARKTMTALTPGAQALILDDAVHSEGADTWVVTGERVFLNLGTRASLPDVPGMIDAMPMTHIEALDLERVPDHLIVLGGGYVAGIAH